MANQNEKLADSLSELQQLQARDRRVFRSEELSRGSRLRLLKAGFIREVMRGWLISADPSLGDHETTPWYASFWEFCGLYCHDRFGDEWCLSPEHSLLLHGENTITPSQIVIYSPKGLNNKVGLLFGTSIYDLKHPAIPPARDVEVKNGIRRFTLESALIRASESLHQRYPIESRVVLASVRDPTELLHRLLAGGHSSVAGRLAGGFRRIGRPKVAEEIVATMRAAGFVVRETDPLGAPQAVVPLPAGLPPIVGRLRAMWESMRGTVLEVFPRPAAIPRDGKRYLTIIDEIYQHDAYHSLSIEGYRVTPELIERVRAGNWDPDSNEVDRQGRDALAARGYWQAFQAVRQNSIEIFGGAEPSKLVRNSHREWYRELFQPCVAAGIIPASTLAGYRNHPVYLRTSRYVPPRWEVMRDAMPGLFDLLEEEPDAGVRAVLGHWMFGYIHPYPDGNGRLARFLMNTMLASGGYPWTIVRVQDRATYLPALDRASLNLDIRPFAEFIAERVKAMAVFDGLPARLAADAG